MIEVIVTVVKPGAPPTLDEMARGTFHIPSEPIVQTHRITFHSNDDLEDWLSTSNEYGTVEELSVK